MHKETSIPLADFPCFQRAA
uniref:Uncharacterized protein n=1 Tax=Arundo donax TaxID=35708 RepID=A0A0A9BXT4_ARUDO